MKIRRRFPAFVSIVPLLLLGYHYMVCGHLDTAAASFEKAASPLPADDAMNFVLAGGPPGDPGLDFKKR